MAAIDLYAAEIAWAHQSGNDKALSLIAHSFYSRLGYDKRMPNVDPEDVVAAKATDFGFWLKFVDGTYLHYRRQGGRWCISKSDSDAPQSFDAHDYVIEKMCVPFAFLQGLSFAFECLESISRDSLSLFVEDAQKAAADADRRKDEALDRLIKYEARAHKAKLRHESILKEIKVLASGKFLETSGVVRILTSASDDPPAPPAASVSVPVAKASLVGRSGVYFLWRGGEIVYVGRANCIAKRLSGHHVAEAGDFVSFIEMPASETWVVEPYYIWKLRPRLNGEVQAMENVSSGRPARRKKTQPMELHANATY